jgi:hypothetical protein
MRKSNMLRSVQNYSISAQMLKPEAQLRRVHGGVEIDEGDSRTPKKYLISEQSSAVLDFFFVSFFCVKTKERKG